MDTFMNVLHYIGRALLWFWAILAFVGAIMLFVAVNFLSALSNSRHVGGYR